MAYTTDDLLIDLKRDSYMPAAQTQFTDAKLLALADKCIQRRILPAFIGIGDGFYRETSDTTLVADQTGYDLPRYAFMNKIHQARLLGSDGKKLGKLLTMSPSDRDYWNSTSSGTPVRIEFNADQMYLIPAPATGVLTSWPSLRVWYYRRPGRMVSTSSAAVVSSVVGTTVTYTAAKPSTFTASSVHDFYRGNSPFRRVGSAVTATGSPLTTTQTFAAADAALLQAGDYVCMRDETVFPPCPIEAVPFLVELMIKSISKTQGDKAQFEMSMKEIVDDMLVLISSAANRADAMPQTQSLLRSPFVRAIGRRGHRSTLT